MNLPVGDLAVGKAEYTFPMFKLGKDLLFRGDVFIDAGETESRIPQMGNLRAGAGAGLRLVVPSFGGTVAGLDIAAPMAARDGDHKQPVSFFVGVSF